MKETSETHQLTLQLAGQTDGNLRAYGCP